MELIIGVLEDNDDNDDTATGNSDWVLSIKDKPKLYDLAFKPAVATSTPLRALTGAREIMEAGEEATDAADATAFCTTVASTRNTKTSVLPFFLRELLLLLLLLQLHAAHLLQQPQNLNPN